MRYRIFKIIALLTFLIPLHSFADNSQPYCEVYGEWGILQNGVCVVDDKEAPNPLNITVSESASGTYWADISAGGVITRQDDFYDTTTGGVAKKTPWLASAEHSAQGQYIVHFTQGLFVGRPYCVVTAFTSFGDKYAASTYITGLNETQLSYTTEMQGVLDISRNESDVESFVECHGKSVDHLAN